MASPESFKTVAAGMWQIFTDILDPGFLSSHAQTSAGGTTFTKSVEVVVILVCMVTFTGAIIGYISNMITSIIALVEEGLKFIALFLATRNNKNFNSLFDGLIYAVFVSLGFAAFENVLYVVSYGWTNALVRAVTAVPGHMFFAVLMGYYYSMWHVCEQAKTMERALKKRGLVDKNSKEISGKHHLICSLLVPVLAHGLYDYCCTSETVWADIVFYALLIFLYVYCFKRIKEMSKGDMEDKRFAAVMVFKKYPHLLEALRLETEQRMRSQVNS